MTEVQPYHHITSAIPVDTPEETVLHLWLNKSHSLSTRRAYLADIARLQEFVQKPLQQVTLPDLSAFAESITLKVASKNRILSSVKSFYTFAHATGYLPINVAAALTLEKAADTKTHRLLTEAQAIKMISLEPNCRNHAILRLLYVAGLRAAEICVLTWRDCSPILDTVELAIFGKGSRSRKVLIPEDMWKELQTLRGEALDEEYIFPSRKGTHGGKLSTVQIYRIVNAAAARAKVELSDTHSLVSPHWLRHAHVTHALDNGAPIHIVQETVGHSSAVTTGRYAHKKPTESSATFIHA